MTSPLPPLVVVTDGAGTAGRDLVEVVTAAVAGGARAVLLREKHLPRDRRAALARRLRAVLADVGGLLVVGSDPTIPADGLHLAADDPLPEHRPAILGRSCHSRDDVGRAAAQGCTYVTLSPIFLTSSKPGYGPALGPEALADLPLPVWAQGGVDASTAAVCMVGGATGVAVMGAVMRADDPQEAVNGIRSALEGGRR